MINIEDNTLCSGCAACDNACPTGSISMLEDDEGFLYPSVDDNSCIRCTKCIKACPYINLKYIFKNDSEELSQSYAAYHKDEEIRFQSSSGGIFRAIADLVLSENGIVFGAAFDENFQVYHNSAETYEEVKKFMGSKYLQSRIGLVYRKIEEYLNNGEKVLFTGVACQIAGLKQYLKTDRPNLICIDVICCGVGSPKIWREYLKFFFPNFQIKLINFREKISGWDSSTMKIQSENQEYNCCIYKNIYFKNLRNNLFIRPSCESCKFKNKNRVSDFTIGDCWGYKEIAPEIYDNKGLSSIIVHTEKGERMINLIRHKLVIKEIQLDDIEKYNSNYLHSESFNKVIRCDFWQDYKKLSFKKLFRKYGDINKNHFTTRILKILARYIIPKPIKKIIKFFINVFLTRAKLKEILSEDKKFNESFRFNSKEMPPSFKRKPEWKFIVLYRKYQINYNNILGVYYKNKLNNQGLKSGIDFAGNLNIGRGLIIGHYGRIVLNNNVKFGEQIYLTHGVTIGQNAVGKRKGVPTIGNRVRIGANANIIGNITIGDDVLIAPGAFVNFDVPSHSIVVGNPGQIHHKKNATEGYLGKFI